MTSHPVGTALLLPNGRVEVDVVHGISADASESVSESDETIELLLVLAGRQTMTSDPRARVAGLFPDGGVSGLGTDSVAADVLEAVSLADQAVECGLVIGRGQTVPGNPSTRGGFIPDGGVSILAVDGVSIDQDWMEALADIGVEGGLIFGRRQAMSCHPGWRCPLFPDGSIAGVVVDGVAADIAQTIALGNEAVKGVLILH